MYNRGSGPRIAREQSCDLVIGLGGGSPMDAARAIAAMAKMDGSILDHLRGRPIDRPGLPLINIATTAGTASEITAVAVVLDEERQLKFGMKSPYWYRAGGDHRSGTDRHHVTGADRGDGIGRAHSRHRILSLHPGHRPHRSARHQVRWN